MKKIMLTIMLISISAFVFASEKNETKPSEKSIKKEECHIIIPEKKEECIATSEQTIKVMNADIVFKCTRKAATCKEAVILANECTQKGVQALIKFLE